MNISNSYEKVKKLIRDANCSGCEWTDTHDGISCYMFEDRGDCYVKRPRNRPSINKATPNPPEAP